MFLQNHTGGVNSLFHQFTVTYRFGFNGKEYDNEVYGDANFQDYGMRMYDPRLGRFVSVDPLTKDYPWYTPYQFAGNKPINSVDLDGAEEILVIRWYDGNTYIGQTYTYIPTAQRVKQTGALYVSADIHNQLDLTRNGIRLNANNQFESDSPYELTEAQMSYFFNTDASGARKINEEHAEYSPTLRNKNYESAVIKDLENSALTGDAKPSGNISADYPGGKDIYFPYDSYDPFAAGEINENVITGYQKYLLNNPDWGLLLIGHSSSENSTGDPDYNMTLSLDRATSVQNGMVNGGISSDRIKSQGAGDTQPVCTERTDECYQKNRRVRITNVPLIR